MYIGLDLGTSGLKGLVIDEDQTILAEATAPLEVVRPFDGWSEQAPASWLDAADLVMRALGARVALGHVRAIGLSGQMHGATLLDAADEVLRPCILWNDTRAASRGRGAGRRPGVPRDHRQHRVSRLHRAEARLGAGTRARRSSTRSRKVLLPKDYLRLWLTGEDVSEMSDAAGTTLARCRRARLVRRAAGRDRACGRDQMPRLVEGIAGVGHAARRTWRALGPAAAAWSWPAAAATMRPRPSASACVDDGRRLRLARHVGRAVRGQRTPISPMPGEARCTPSAMRCPIPGTRWA